MTACWFCEERSADPESELEIKMYQHVPPYHSTTISVDRCEGCMAIHTRIQENARRIAVVAIVIPTALCLLSLLIGYISDRKLPWGIAAGIATIATFIIVGVASVWERRMRRSGNMRFKSDGRTKHPRVKELKEQGWKLHEKAVRPTEEAEPKRPAAVPVSCAQCGVPFPRAAMEMALGGRELAFGGARPGTSQYAGICPQCGKPYCARCASARGVTFQCPDCDIDLLVRLPDEGVKMDIKFLQIWDLVKMGVPGTNSIQLKEFMRAQDQERQRWFETATLMDVADWIVATMRSQSKG
jgi:hypothetical protein